jgi:hypothetical protein
MVEALKEEVPLGLRDPLRRAAESRTCGRCAARLLTQPHFPWCPTRKEWWRVTRLATCEADRVLEDHLEVANRRAVDAWLASGRDL